MRLPDSDTEIVLSCDLPYAPNWLVTSVPQAVADIRAAGGALVLAPRPIAVGRLAIVADPFGNYGRRRGGRMMAVANDRVESQHGRPRRRRPGIDVGFDHDRS